MSADAENAVTEVISIKQGGMNNDGSGLLGTYRVVSRIAVGGMATVYLGSSRGAMGFHRLVAIKVLHPHLGQKGEFVEMFLDEARLAARLHHPNVVSVVDLGMEDDSTYVIMDYVEGCTLGQLLRQSASDGGEPARNWKHLVVLAIDALQGLSAAHSLKDELGRPLRVVHRDISPENILVGVDGIARVTDFGVAKAESRVTETRPGVRKGKFQYMSPEQVCANPNVDPRSDIFGFGVVLWNALTGQKLFRGADHGETIKNVLTKDIERPSKFTKGLPKALDQIVLRALERNPKRRYQSAEEMADALRVLAQSEKIISARSDISEWVYSAFGDVLERRRGAIAETLGIAVAVGQDEDPTIQMTMTFPEVDTTEVRERLPELDEASWANELHKTRSESRGLLWVATGFAALVGTIVALLLTDGSNLLSPKVTASKSNVQVSRKVAPFEKTSDASPSQTALPVASSDPQQVDSEQQKDDEAFQAVSGTRKDEGPVEEEGDEAQRSAGLAASSDADASRLKKEKASSEKIRSDRPDAQKSKRRVLTRKRRAENSQAPSSSSSSESSKSAKPAEPKATPPTQSGQSKTDDLLDVDKNPYVVGG